MARNKNQTVKYVLIAILVLGLAYLLMRKVQEGFASETVELFHKVPASNATTADKEYMIPASVITAKTGKTLNRITLQRFDKPLNKYVNVNMANVAGTNSSFPRFNIFGGDKTGLVNSTYNRTLTGAQVKLPLTTNHAALSRGIKLVNLDSNPLGITTSNYQLDPNGKNLKIILEFV